MMQNEEPVCTFNSSVIQLVEIIFQQGIATIEESEGPSLEAGDAK